jgi:hypothetical protein
VRFDLEIPTGDVLAEVNWPVAAQVPHSDGVDWAEELSQNLGRCVPEGRSFGLVLAANSARK